MNDKLINYIKDHKIDVEKLAIRCGIPQIRMNEIMNNVRKPTSKEIGKIASKLLVTLDKITEDEDILQADNDNKVRIKKEKRPQKSIKFGVIGIIGLLILLFIVFITFTLNRVVRIECKYQDKYYKEEVQYNLIFRDIKLQRIKNNDGNEYNKYFYDIHYNQIKKEYNGNCTVEKRKAMKLWKLD